MKGILEWMEDGVQTSESAEMSSKEVKSMFEKGIGKLKKEISSELIKKLEAPKVKDAYNTFAFKRKGKDIETFSQNEAAYSIRAAVELLYGAICREFGLNEKDLDRIVAKAYGFSLSDVQKFTQIPVGKSILK